MKTGLPVPASLIREIYGHDLFEYYLVMLPDPFVNDKIMEKRKEYFDENNIHSLKEAIPHIRIASFYAKETMELTMVRWIERICKQLNGFEIVVNNYGGLPPHTIYLHILNDRPFMELINKMQVLDNYIQSCVCPAVSFHSRPYLSVMANLDENLFSKAMAKYARESFHETFITNELQLVKRKYEFDLAKTIHIFGMKPYSQFIAIEPS